VVGDLGDGNGVGMPLKCSREGKREKPPRRNKEKLRKKKARCPQDNH